MKTSGFREIDFDEKETTKYITEVKVESNYNPNVLTSMLSDVLMGLSVIAFVLGLAFLIYKFFAVFMVLAFLGFCGAIGSNL